MNACFRLSIPRSLSISASQFPSSRCHCIALTYFKLLLECRELNRTIKAHVLLSEFRHSAPFIIYTHRYGYVYISIIHHLYLSINHHHHHHHRAHIHTLRAKYMLVQCNRITFSIQSHRYRLQIDVYKIIYIYFLGTKRFVSSNRTISY